MGARSKNSKIKNPVMLDEQDIENLGGVENDTSIDQEKMILDKFPQIAILYRQKLAVLNAMDSSDDVGIAAMLHLITLAIPLVRDSAKSILREERDKFKQYVRDEVHLSVPLAGYAIPGEQHLRSVEEGNRCKKAYWYLKNNPDLPFYNQTEYNQYAEDALLWRRMMNNPVSMRKSTWRSNLMLDVDDALAIVDAALDDAGILKSTRGFEPAGGEP